MSHKAIPGAVAVMATVTAASLSVIAGVQRGGTMAERAAWVALGAVLCVAAHLIPAYCRREGKRVGVVGALIWVFCMVMTCYGHAVFFSFASQHAGESRAAAVTVMQPVTRDPVTIQRDRADAAGKLARVTAQLKRSCSHAGDCPLLEGKAATLAGQVSAFDTEMSVANADRARIAREQAKRDAARLDPVSAALCSIGLGEAFTGLAMGIVSAVTLECVACFFWFLTFGPSGGAMTAREERMIAAIEDAKRVFAQPVTPPARATVTKPANPVGVTPVTLNVTAGHAAPGKVTAKARSVTATPAGQSAVAAVLDEFHRAKDAVATNEIRGTVSEIRRFLGCSQTKAAAIAKQIKGEA